jgi:hypothetical protein
LTRAGAEGEITQRVPNVVFEIREAQFDALADARREDFTRRTMDLLWERHDAAASLDAAALRAVVSEGIDAGASYGLFADDDLVPFIECRLLYGPEFPLRDDDAWAREILDDPDFDADDKALRLEGQVMLTLYHDDATE